MIESVSNDNATVATAKTAITQAVTNQSLAGFDNLAPVIKQTFTLTVDQDIFTTGTGNDLFLAPIGGIFGFQPTLTPFDTLIDSGKNNALQAFFAGSLLGGPTIVGGLTIQGIQTWQFENAGTTAVLINGGVNVGGPGPSNGGAGNAGTNPGVTTITIINSSAGVAVGGNGFGAPGAGTGLANLVQTVNVANITGGFTKVVVGAGQFTGTDTIALNIANLPAGYSINIGPDSGTTGYQTWNIMVNDNGAGATVDTHQSRCVYCHQCQDNQPLRRDRVHRWPYTECEYPFRVGLGQLGKRRYRQRREPGWRADRDRRGKRFVPGSSLPTPRRSRASPAARAGRSSTSQRSLPVLPV